MHSAVVLAFDNPAAFRPLSYSVPPPLLPLDGVPILEHVLRAAARGGAKRIVVLTDEAGDPLRAPLERLASGLPPMALERLPAHGNLAARLVEILIADRERVLVVPWNALWLERAVEQRLSPPLAAEEHPDVIEIRLSGAFSGLFTHTDALRTCTPAFAAPDPGDRPAAWLNALSQAATRTDLQRSAWPVAADEPVVDSIAGLWRAQVERRTANTLHVDPTCVVESGAVLQAPACLHAAVHLAAGARVSASILLGRNEIGANSRLDGCVLGPGDSLEAGQRLEATCLHLGEMASLAEPAPVNKSASVRATRQEPDEAEARAIVRQVETYVRDVLGLRTKATGRGGRILRAGFNNRVCLVREDGSAEAPRSVIAKWSLAPNARSLWIEHQCLRLLAPAGLTIRPHLLDLRRTAFPHPALLSELRPGRELRSEDLDPPMLRRIGVLLRRLHAHRAPHLADFPHCGWRSVSEAVKSVWKSHRYYAWYREQAGLPQDALADRIKSEIQSLQRIADEAEARGEGGELDATEARLCHGDPVPHNFLWNADGGDLVLLDWERAGAGDPACEIGWFLILNQLGGEREAAFLEGYGAAADWPRMHVLRNIIALSWPVALIAHHAQWCLEQFAVSTTPAYYHEFQTRESYLRLAQGLGTTPAELQALGALFAEPRKTARRSAKKR